MTYTPTIEKDYRKWLKKVKQEQRNYPYLKGKTLADDLLRVYFERGQTPIDTLNALLTIC